MYDNEYFVVDMASCTSTGEIINSISLALETLNHTGKKIVLKLNESYLNQSQMLSIQSLITSYGCILDTVETINDDTARIAENMNIYVQKPIEKRIEEKYPAQKNEEFQPFSLKLNKEPDIISLKEVNGLHFEADLDAIQKQQNEININNDLREAGINPRSDFKTIEAQISSQYQTEEILPKVEECSNISTVAESISYSTATFEENKEFENVEKNSIGVYKKAYDENQIQDNQWEEVDFYETPTSDPVVSDTKNTTYINQTLRSGQILEADGNVVIIGDCHPGSEVRALGDITVWGVLSGIAHAGCKGNINAKVRALKMNAVQLRIGNCYSRRPDGTNIPYIIRSSIFTPEEARVIDGEIMLFKINQN
ncbi:MAG: septum site-determining protein MinC [Candidatus Gastranaerophilales bacterium]|nr:septum site-determining protein MinC [Candidatus Gastranaerophilales bacterium]